jgi:SAM-dependent methyltransferase
MTCSNDDCGHVFSTLDGADIPVVLPDPVEPFLALDAQVDFSDPAAVEAWMATLEPGSSDWELALRTGMYGTAHYGQPETLLTRLYERFVRHLPIDLRTVVDLGCGVGGFSHVVASRRPCEVVGLDASGLALRLAAAAWEGGELAIPELQMGVQLGTRRYRLPSRPRTGRIRWLCADVHNPPLMAGAFDLVAAVNLIDSTVEPMVALGQAAAMVRPGGYLLLAQPDAWNAPATPPDHWLPSSDEAWNELLKQFGLETVERDDGFEWELARTPRFRYRYVSHARLARRIIPTS